MPKKLILFPYGGNAREALMAIEAINKVQKTWEVVGFIDDDVSAWDKKLNGIKVLGDRDVLKKFPNVHILAVPGNPKNYLKRKEIIDSLRIEKSRFANVIHPSAAVSSDVKMGYNTLIMAHVIISCSVFVGNHCVILPNTTIAHDTQIGDYCCIGSNVAISGSVVIESNCYIGSGTNIRENITIGEKSLVGLGANVVSDVQKRVVIVGNPAKPMRKITE